MRWRKRPLSDEQVFSIVRRYAAGEPAYALANEFGIGINRVQGMARDADIEVRSRRKRKMDTDDEAPADPLPKPWQVAAYRQRIAAGVQEAVARRMAHLTTFSDHAINSVAWEPTL